MKLLEILKTPIESLKGIRPEYVRKLKKAGYNTIEDLLYLAPKAYEDRRRLKKIGELREGEKAVFIGRVEGVNIVKTASGKEIFEVTFSDKTGSIVAKWFNFNRRGFLERFKINEEFLIAGRIGKNLFEKTFEIIHPETRSLRSLNLEDTLRVIPIYPSIMDLESKTLESIIDKILRKIETLNEDYLPSWLLMELKLPLLNEAFIIVHRGLDDLDKLSEARSKGHVRLIFDEFFLPQVAIHYIKRSIKGKSGIAFNVDSRLVETFINNLPFELTSAQKRVIEEIKEDMASPKMMNRLLQGDVGSGKTVVAIVSALIAVENGYQVAFMAPTEILAEQHFYNIREYTRGLKLRIALLTSSTSRSEREIILRSLRHGAIDIIVGTHAIIQERIEFKKLGLVIIDEQHRFGVIQRKKLREKGENPDLLVMTATPIPRTLALTVYGDLDISTIDELPAGRKPITTRVITEKDRIKAYAFIESQLRKGRQAFIVYPIIEESEKLDLPAVTEAYPKIKEFFREFNVGMLHGRMSWNEKERIMNKFKSGEIHLLVCTPVIEVGIDVPNATVMLIEGAERFGLSQLHQLRGRVGRSTYKSYCLLMISGNRLSGTSYMRLKILEETMDGFKIAEEDLNLRGPGEFFGVRQSGMSEFKIANLFRDRELLELARKMAEKLIEMDPHLQREEHAYIKKLLRDKNLLDAVDLLNSG